MGPEKQLAFDFNLPRFTETGEFLPEVNEDSDSVQIGLPLVFEEEKARKVEEGTVTGKTAANPDR